MFRIGGGADIEIKKAAFVAIGANLRILQRSAFDRDDLRRFCIGGNPSC
jgi:hypothetical protein